MAEVRRVLVDPVLIVVERVDVPATDMPARTPAVIMPMFDRVYSCLPPGGLGGHNVVSYEPGPDRWRIEVGVTVPPGADPGPVEGLVRSTLPGGEVATTVHRGPYDRLAEAHDRVQAWCAARAAAVAGFRNWEVYGDWCEDPAELETEVTYLLAPCATEP